MIKEEYSRRNHLYQYTFILSGNTVGPFVRTDISCKDYTAPPEITFITAKKAVAVNPMNITTRTVMAAVTNTTSHSPTKAGASVITIIT